ncbi:hypothetical protein K504DRAFT_518662 [Pleomassaria siparia CBS 279.74]|uniref:NB-ARC domain-containing protein n=1 Tax=Pleomassaria siparia CBS 279.74 TaxID=1314801 RepID=A0A6G1JU50_9PLEO|nr:hypothetical protein K504DRAFT_518662 [Pleomassaria siparia CBS 279.74]
MYPNIYDSTIGLIFFGTPFRGTDTLTIAKIVELAEQEFGGDQVLGKALRTSEVNDEALTGLVDDYLRTTGGGVKPTVACFFERMATNVAKLVNKEDVSIAGLGGTGKTRVALQFAYKVKETWPEFSIIWLPALSMKSFEQACTEVAKALHIPRTAAKEENAKELVRQWFSAERAGQWLLVLDNADDKDILFGTGDAKGIFDYLPKSEEGVTVYTTRTQEVAQRLTLGSVMNVGPMSQSDAPELFEKLLRNKELLRNGAVTTELLDALAYLPLAIAQAAAYLNIHKIPIEKYLRLLHNTEQDIVHLMSEDFRDDRRYKGSANAVATTWVVSFKQIRERDATAADLLAFISCIEWKSIPRSLLPIVQPEARTERAIGVLCGYSFLARRADNTTRDWTNKLGNRTEVEKKAVQHVSEIFPHMGFEKRAAGRIYLPHAIQLLTNAQDHSPRDKSQLLFLVGSSLLKEGRFKEAPRWLNKCWSSLMIKELDRDDPIMVMVQRAIALACAVDGQEEEAVMLMDNVYSVYQRAREKDPEELVKSRERLRLLYKADGELERGLDRLEYLVVEHQKELNEAHPDLPDAQMGKALDIMEYFDAVRKKVQVAEHPDLPHLQQQLAFLYVSIGQVQDALELMQQVVAVHREKLRVTAAHLALMQSQQNLAAQISSARI